jgi:mannosylglycerate hydrolase
MGIKTARMFGGYMKVGYIPDQFGHIAQMPQILKGFNINFAVIYRGFGGEPGQESSEYIWEAPDGSWVLMFHLPKDGYSFGYFAMDDDEMIVQRFERLRAEIDSRAQTLHRLILNGGDHHWPDFKLPHAIEILRSKYPDFEFLHSTLENYARKVKSKINIEKLPRLIGETRFGLKHAFAVIGGTASSRNYIKQKNYLAQVKLEKFLEPLNAISFIIKGKDRSEIIKQAWIYCLQNQDHDTINGTSVDRVYYEALVRYLKIDEIAKALSFQISNDLIPYDSRFFKDDICLFVFNFLPFRRDELVECEIEFHLRDVIVGLNPDVKLSEEPGKVSGFKIYDGEGREVEYQILNRSEGYSLVWGYHEYPHQIFVDKFRILLDARNLPALGWKKFDIRKVDSIPKYSSKVNIWIDESGKIFMEGRHLKIQINEDGSLKITSKELDFELDNLNIFEESGDAGDEYNYCPPDRDEIYLSTDFKPDIKIIETGPLRCAVQVHYSIPVPEDTDQDKRSEAKVNVEIISTIYLCYNSKRADIKTRIINRARNHRIRVIFDTGMETDISYADSQFCLVKRRHKKYNWDDYPYEKPLNLEVLQRFVCVQDRNRGIAILTKGLYEYELSTENSGRLAITLLRGVGQLSKSNLKTRPGGDAGWKNETPDAQCLGTYEFEYSIYLYKPDRFDMVNYQAEIYHVQNFVVRRKQRIDNLSEISLVEIDGRNIAFSAFKVSEDGKGIILRFYNFWGEKTKSRVKFNFEHKNLFLVKLNEEKLKVLKPDDSGYIQIEHKPFKIITLKLEIKNKGEV